MSLTPLFQVSINTIDVPLGRTHIVKTRSIVRPLSRLVPFSTYKTSKCTDLARKLESGYVMAYHPKVRLLVFDVELHYQVVKDTFS